MSSDKLLRWSGLALILGGIAIALFVLVHPFGERDIAQAAPTGRWAVAHSLHLVGLVLTLLGLVGLYARQAQQTGGLGFIGFVLAFLGTALTAGLVAQAVQAFPVVAANAPALVADDGALVKASLPPVLLFGVIAYFLGYILLGIATLRARVFPPLGAVLLVIGAVLFNVPPKPVGPAPYIVPFLGGLVFGVGLVWLGLGLWLDARQVARRS